MVGALLLTAPAILRTFDLGVTGVSGEVSTVDGLPAWLRLSVLAGRYLIEWGPVAAGLLIIWYACRRNSVPKK